MKINLKRFLVSGLVSGLLIIVSGACMFPVVGNQMTEALASRLVPPLSVYAMIYFAIMSILLGYIIVFFNIFVKDLFNKKIKAAVAVALIIWFLTYFWSNAAHYAYGFFPLTLVIIGTVWGLVELIIISIVGSVLYFGKK